LLAATGLAGPLWLQVVLFAVLSVAALLSLRRLVTTRLRLAGPTPKVDRLIGETAVALEEMAVDAIGKVELRGAAWTARNIGESTLAPGRRCTVVRVEGLTLWVCDELGMGSSRLYSAHEGLKEGM
jgi:membrane protein implicated in regulation of membrane protease activity